MESGPTPELDALLDLPSRSPRSFEVSDVDMAGLSRPPSSSTRHIRASSAGALGRPDLVPMYSIYPCAIPYKTGPRASPSLAAGRHG
jgi:hypothetical protein